MNVKLDTKEKFTVITPNTPEITANMTGELKKLVIPYLTRPVPHIVLNLKNVSQVDEEAANLIAELQHQFYDQQVSFIVCELQNKVEMKFNELDLSENMNITPTESEAWDILQMEEVERELMRDLDDNPEL